MIGETWPEDVEIYLALNVNKTTLKNADISENLIIDTLADQFGATTQIQVQYQSFSSMAKSQIHDPSFLEVMSYHDKNGKVVSDAVILTTGLLKPINSRPEGLYFAKLRCEFDFTEVKKDNIPAIAVPVDCFVPLAPSTNVTRTRAGLDATFVGSLT